MQFLKETKPNLVKEWDPETAKRYVKSLIAVESFSLLDRDPAAAQRYDQMVWRPFRRWAHQEP